MIVFAWIALFVLVPLVVGGTAGFVIRPGGGRRRTSAVAGICAIAIVAIVVFVGGVTTPQSACGKTGCDTSYSIGAMFLAVPVFLLALAGVAGGRSFALRRTPASSPSPGAHGRS